MKRILAPILFLVLSFPTLALGEEVTMKDLVERDGLYYQKFTDVPFTGKTTGQSQGSFSDGKKHGSWEEYNKGRLLTKGTYKKGKKHGSWVMYYDNGQLELETTFKNGYKYGPQNTYHENGKLKCKGTNKSGHYVGALICYYDTGHVSSTHSSYGLGVSVYYYENKRGYADPPIRMRKTYRSDFFIQPQYFKRSTMKTDS